MERIYLSSPLWYTLGMRFALVLSTSILAAVLLWFAHYLYYASTGVVPKPSPDLPSALTPLGDQLITAPIIAIPYVQHLTSIESVTDPKGATQVATKDIYNHYTAILLPEELNIKAEWTDKQRINIKLTGNFDYQPILHPTDDGEIKAQWDKARLLIGIQETAALLPDVEIVWDDDPLELQAGVSLINGLDHGFSAIFPHNSGDMSRQHAFEIRFNLKAGQSIRFVPVGKKSHIELKTSRPSRLIGQLTPDKQNRDSSTSVLLQWDIAHLVRDYPQYWALEQQVTPYDLHKVSVGVMQLPSSATPIAQDSTSTNSLFWLHLAWISLGFIICAVFAVELISQRYIHWLHYIILGLMLNISWLVFYTLEPSITWAYAYQFSQAGLLLLLAFFAWLLFGLWYGWAVVILSGAGLSCVYLLAYHTTYALLPALGISLLLLLLLLWGSYRASPPESP